MITRQAFHGGNLGFDPGQPPPLCFTVPAANRMAAGGLQRWAPSRFTLGTPRLAMDPHDPATWQRPYVFTP